MNSTMFSWPCFAMVSINQIVFIRDRWWPFLIPSESLARKTLKMMWAFSFSSHKSHSFNILPLVFLLFLAMLVTSSALEGSGRGETETEARGESSATEFLGATKGNQDGAGLPRERDTAQTL